MIQTEQDTLLFEEKDFITVTWNPLDMSRSVGNVVNTANAEVGIKLVEIDPNTDELTKELVTLATGIPNTGVADLGIQGLDQFTGTELHQVSLIIEVTSGGPVSKRSTGPPWWEGIFLRSYKFFVLDNDEDPAVLCEEWASTEPTSVGQEILRTVRREFPCPPTADQARNKEISNLELSNTLISVFHPMAKNCFRQSAGTE